MLIVGRAVMVTTLGVLSLCGAKVRLPVPPL